MTSAPAVRRRARPLSPQERRETLIDTTLRLVRQHGRAVTTRQIAEAAGVAEGTIFRVFDTKDDLVDAAVARAFEPGLLEARLAEIDPAAPLRHRLVLVASILQQRYQATFGLMAKVGLLQPPDHVRHSERQTAWRARLAALLAGVVGPDADRLTVAPSDLVHRLRLLTFAGSHPQLTDGHLLTPEEIVDTLLGGLLRPEDPLRGDLAPPDHLHDRTGRSH